MFNFNKFYKYGDEDINRLIDKIKDEECKWAIEVLSKFTQSRENAVSTEVCRQLARRIIDLEKTIELYEKSGSEPERTYKIIAVDFDGTLCEDMWPAIGKANEDMIDYLKRRQVDGDKLILWTCRDGQKLFDAIDWCESHGLSFDAINDNLQEMKEKFAGSNPRKIYADIYIDDHNYVEKEVSNENRRYRI